MVYEDEFKLEVVGYAEEHGQSAAGRKYDITRRTVYNWIQDKEKIEARLEAYEKGLAERGEKEVPVSEAVVRIEDLMAGWRGIESRLESIDTIDRRKRLFMGALEKVMADVLHLLDTVEKRDMKPVDMMKVLKEANEVREKLAGDPSVIIEVRHKVREDVIRVLSDKYLDDAQIDEFVRDMERIEEADYVVQ